MFIWCHLYSANYLLFHQAVYKCCSWFIYLLIITGMIDLVFTFCESCHVYLFSKQLTKMSFPSFHELFRVIFKININLSNSWSKNLFIGAIFLLLGPSPLTPRCYFFFQITFLHFHWRLIGIIFPTWWCNYICLSKTHCWEWLYDLPEMSFKRKYQLKK